MRPIDGLTGLYRYFARRPRLTMVLVLTGLATSLIYGTYLFIALRATQERLVEAERRLHRAEMETGASTARMEEALGRLQTAEREVREAIESLAARQEEADRAAEEAFSQKLAQVREEAAERLSRLSETDAAGRRRLDQETGERLSALRDEMSRQMVQAYSDFKAREEQLIRSLAERIEAGEIAGDAFKRIYQEAREAVLFIRIDYQVRWPRTGDQQEFVHVGTGFTVTPDGRALTARHVIMPWLYDRQFAVLSGLGLAELVPDSVRISAWTMGARVEQENGVEPVTLFRNAFVSGTRPLGLRLLFAAQPELEEEVVNTPMGVTRIRMPKVGRRDVAVFQLFDFSRRFPYLDIARLPLETSTLDEVLALGYPFSSLQSGVATPQASLGRVRRISKAFIELDSPLHPGISGGPVLDKHGKLIGLASATLGSPVYGIAVRAEDMVAALSDAESAVRREQRRLAALGCDPGPADGRIGPRTLQAYDCERARDEGR